MPDGLLSDELLNPDEQRKAALGAFFPSLLQAGLSAVAAGGQMYDWQRAPLIAQAGQAFDDLALEPDLYSFNDGEPIAAG